MKPRALTPAAALVLIALATPAAAYVGPGAGLSLLGALWGLIVAVVVTLGFVILWPLRRMFRRKRTADAQAGSESRRETVEEPEQGTAPSKIQSSSR